VATDRSQSIEITPAGGLTSEEIDRLVAEAEDHRDQDHERREVRRLNNRLEGIINTNERVFGQFRDIMSEGDRRRNHDTVLQARAAHNRDNKAEIVAAMYDLNSISAKLSELMLNQ
jgi:molecular chaperone DnaK